MPVIRMVFPSQYYYGKRTCTDCPSFRTYFWSLETIPLCPNGRWWRSNRGRSQNWCRNFMAVFGNCTDQIRCWKPGVHSKFVKKRSTCSVMELWIWKHVQIERLYWSVVREVNHDCRRLEACSRWTSRIAETLADKYFATSRCSSPYRIPGLSTRYSRLPIQRLDERPTVRQPCRTSWLGWKIANFISTKNVAHYLPTHSLKSKEPYYMGVFLVGAYQRFWSMHNLFGDTNAVHVSVNEKDIPSNSDWWWNCSGSADYVQYSPKKLVRTLELELVTQSVKRTYFFVEEGKRVPFQLSFRSVRIYLFGIEKLKAGLRRNKLTRSCFIAVHLSSPCQLVN